MRPVATIPKLLRPRLRSAISGGPTLGVLVLLLGAAGCQHRGHAEATASAASPSPLAPASVGERTAEHDRYDANVLARTGITIDREIVDACHVDGAQTFFAFDSTKVTPRTHDVLALVAACVNEGPLKGRELELVGHADPRGSDDYNKELGLTRAESVAECLREHGVAPTNLEINSVGEGPASSEPSEWPLDRRVEIRVKPAATAAR